MIEILRNIAKDIRQGQNLESYIIIGLIIIIVVADIFGLSDRDWVTEITLAVLALLVYDRIQTKRSLENVNSALQAIKNGHLFERSNELDILQINRRIEGAKTIDWLAFTNEKTVNIFRSHISTCLSQGGQIRIIMVDPDGLFQILGNGIPSAVENEAKHYRKGVAETIRRCEKIMRETGKRNIQIRLLDRHPPYRMTMYNKLHENGYVRIHLLKSSDAQNAASLAWTRKDDPDWFVFFAEQYEHYWNRSKPLLTENLDDEIESKGLTIT